MRRKNMYLGMALLIAVLMLGIGYAAVTQKLTVSGSAKAIANNTSFDIKFTEATASDSNKLSVKIDSDLVASMNVTGMTFVGDKVSATITMANQSPELTAEVAEAVIDNQNSEYFKVTVNQVAGDLAPGATKGIVVTVELIKTPLEVISGTFKVTIDATAKLV